MGHLIGKREVLRDLQRRLDKNPVGAPPHPSLEELLGILFTDEEARIGSRFPMMPSTFEEVERAVDLKGEALREVLEALCRKGLVIDLERDGTVYYVLSMLMIGFFEFTLMRVDEGLPARKVAELMHEYRTASDFYRDFFGSKTPRTRALVYEQAVSAVRSEVVPYDLATEIIRKAGRGGLGRCYCRHEAEHMGTRCSAPIDDICMSLGRASDYMVRRGFARRASQDELLSILAAAEDMGLVHISDNVQQEHAFICNCCGCCCGLLAGINKFDLPHALATSHFLAVCDEAGCTGCGVCAERCQVNAIELADVQGRTVARVKEERCLGCGVCAAACPEGAIGMKQRRRVVLPPRGLEDLMKCLVKEKNRLKHYLG